MRATVELQTLLRAASPSEPSAAPAAPAALKTCWGRKRTGRALSGSRKLQALWDTAAGLECLSEAATATCSTVKCSSNVKCSFEWARQLGF